MKKIYLFFVFLLTGFYWQIAAQAVVENFDSYNAGDNPTGWTKFQSQADDPGFIVTNSQSNSASNSLYHNDDDIATESTSWIVAPVYISTGDDMLEFFYRQNHTDMYYNRSEVLYSTTSNDPTSCCSWYRIAEFNGRDQAYSEDTWTQFRHFFAEPAGTTIYVAFKYTGDYAHEFYIDDYKIDAAPTYFNPEFNLSIVSADCSNNQFSVVVDVSYFGRASFLTVADNQGSASQQISAPTNLVFGPYPNGTNVTFTVTNTDDTSFTSTDIIGYTCPSNNNDRFNAEPLVVYDVGAGAGNEITIDAANYTDSGIHTACDNYGVNLDMWFTVTIPAGETGFKVIYSGNEATNVESAIRDSSYIEWGCSFISSDAYHVYQGLTAGTTFYLQLWLDDFNSGTFNVVVERLHAAPPPVNTPLPANTASSVAIASGRTVGLSWNTATLTRAPDSYKIEYGTTSGTYTGLDNTTNTSYILSGVSENTTYYWKVTPITGGVEATNCPEWSFTTGAFPPAPANDNCSNTTVLSADAPQCITPTIVDNSFALDSGVASPSCANYSGGDLWFSVIVPTVGSIKVETSEVAGSTLRDTGMAIYSGTCGTLTEIACDDDSGNSIFSSIELSGRSPGEILYIRVWEYGNDEFGEFNVCAWDPLSAIADNQIEGFKFFPNPVNNVLNMTAKDNIEAVSITNITGQEVMNVAPNAMETQVNMSQLQNGIYFVKVQVNGQVTAFKVIKK